MCLNDFPPSDVAAATDFSISASGFQQIELHQSPNNIITSI